MPLSSKTTGCCIIGCRTRSGYSKPPGVALHRFPKDPRIRQSWIKAIDRNGWCPSRYSMVCSLHFIETDFHRTGTFRKLKPTAVPTLIDRSYLRPGKSRKLHPAAVSTLNLAGRSCQRTRKLRKIKANAVTTLLDRSYRNKYRRVNRCSADKKQLVAPNYRARHHKLPYYHFTIPSMVNDMAEGILYQGEKIRKSETGRERLYLCCIKKGPPDASYCNLSKLKITNVSSVRTHFFETLSQSDTIVEQTNLSESRQSTKHKIENNSKDEIMDNELPRLKKLRPEDVILDEDATIDSESRCAKQLRPEDLVFNEGEMTDNEMPRLEKLRPADVILDEDETIDNDYQCVKMCKPADEIFNEHDNKQFVEKKSFLKPCSPPLLAYSYDGILSNIRIMYSKIPANCKEPLNQKEINQIPVKSIVRTLPPASFSSDTCDGLLSDIQIVETPFKNSVEGVKNKSTLEILPKKILQKLPIDVASVENDNSTQADIQAESPEVSLFKKSQLKEDDYCTRSRSIKDKQRRLEETVKLMPAIEETVTSMPAIEETVESIQIIEETVESMPTIEENIESMPTIEETAESMQAIEETAESMQAIEETVESMQAIEETVESMQAIEETVKPVQTIEENCENLDENLHKKLADLETEVRRLRFCHLKSQRKIKLLLVQKRRQEKVITVLKNFAVLKGQDSDSKSKLLRNVPSLLRDLLERIKVKRSGEMLSNACSTELIQFVNELHTISPDAYNYLQKEFEFCFPYPKITSTLSLEDKMHLLNSKYSDKPDLIYEVDDGESNSERDVTGKKVNETVSITDKENDNFHNLYSDFESDDEHSHLLQNSRRKSNLLCYQNLKDCLGQKAVMDENIPMGNALEEEYDGEQNYYPTRNLSPLDYVQTVYLE